MSWQGHRLFACALQARTQPTSRNQLTPTPGQNSLVFSQERQLGARGAVIDNNQVPETHLTGGDQVRQGKNQVPLNRPYGLCCFLSLGRS